MIDWFNRNNDNFTLANDDLKLGWDTVLTSQYSKYLYSQSIVSSLLNDNNLLIEELRILVNKISGEIKQIFNFRNKINITWKIRSKFTFN